MRDAASAAAWVLAWTGAMAAGGAQDGRHHVNSIGTRLIRIEAGPCRMGARNPTPGRLSGPGHLPRGDWDEQPVRTVTISQPFHLAETEVTVEQFRQFRPEYQGEGKFVAGVSWHDAVAFCQWLSRKEGKPCRLPTEAEWEYACRAGSSSLFHSGGDPPKHGAPNAWGLRNMHTGVPEWCLDWHGPYPPDDETDPAGPTGGICRVIRGGGLHEALYYRRSANRGGLPPDARWGHRTGFRVVQAPMPTAAPRPVEPPFVQQCVKRGAPHVARGPDPARPHFRKRPILPIPPENVSQEAIRAAGLHPAMLRHNHSPALEVCPNGDVLAIYYTSVHEYTPDVALLAVRLRFGAEAWDMPSLLLDIPDANDHAPLLWNDRGTLRLFWGGPGLPGVPFRWRSSLDSGATWDAIRFPVFATPIGPHSPQPINTAFRDADGAMYVASDGAGGSSVLWVSRDNGRTWLDPGGRTGGRHTTCVLLKDGRILGMGGKNTDIGGFMPQSISADGGRTWQVSRTPFPALGSNQRPSLLRLASGRLLFAGDFQHISGRQPEGVTERGAYVALSDDEGETWRVRKLPGAQLHERPRHDGATIGYSVARQAPNGLIHLITSMNHPSLHFEFNEAWLLREGDEPTPPDPRPVGDVEKHEERYPDGKLKATWSSIIVQDGRYLLHGTELWYHPDGRKQWEVTWRLGRKVGAETYWSSDGTKLWGWEHRDDGTCVWTQWWPSGQKKAESTWRNRRCQGVARRWDPAGKAAGEAEFVDGDLAKGNIALKWSVQRNLQAGDLMYGDRSYRFESVPEALRGCEWIRPANNHSDTRFDPTATFQVVAEADVYIAHDDRAKGPEWLKGWKKTDGKLVGASPQPWPHTVFVRRFKAREQVALGWNGQIGGAGMYLVIIKPLDPAAGKPVITDLRVFDGRAFRVVKAAQ